VIRSTSALYGTGIYMVVLTIQLTGATAVEGRKDFTVHKTRKHGDLCIITKKYYISSYKQ